MSLEEKYVTDKDYFILSDLINQKLGTNTSKYKYPKYVHNTFHAFTNHMTKIDLNLKYINTVCLKLKSLILHLSSQNKIKSNKIEENSGTCAETLSGQENKNNVIKKIILELFKNLTEITIFIYDEYQFDLLLFLNEISGSSLFSTNNIKITIEGYKHMRNDSILKKYLIVSGTYNEVDDILIITRNIMGPMVLNLKLVLNFLMLVLNLKHHQIHFLIHQKKEDDCIELKDVWARILNI
eukprot:472701_1